jgi:archaeoflavoprotein AfpA
MRLLWAMTGSGDRIGEIVDIMKKTEANPRVALTVLLSKAAEQVLRWYEMLHEVQTEFKKNHSETDANTPFIAGPLQMGKYDLFVVAPLTSNSAAKMAYGIADTVVTNCFAQTLKGPTPAVLYPVDQNPGSVTTYGPKGERVEVRAREVDLDNVQKLRMMRNVEVAKSLSDVAEHIEAALEREAELE